MWEKVAVWGGYGRKTWGNKRTSVDPLECRDALNNTLTWTSRSVKVRMLSLGGRGQARWGHAGSLWDFKPTVQIISGFRLKVLRTWTGFIFSLHAGIKSELLFSKIFLNWLDFSTTIILKLWRCTKHTKKVFFFPFGIEKLKQEKCFIFFINYDIVSSSRPPTAGQDERLLRKTSIWNYFFGGGNVPTVGWIKFFFYFLVRSSLIFLSFHPHGQVLPLSLWMSHLSYARTNKTRQSGGDKHRRGWLWLWWIEFVPRRRAADIWAKVSGKVLNSRPQHLASVSCSSITGCRRQRLIGCRAARLFPLLQCATRGLQATTKPPWSYDNQPRHDGCWGD